MSIKKYFYNSVLLCCGVLLSLGAQAAPATINGIKISGDGLRTRIVLTSDQAIEYHFLNLTNPDRLVADITDVKLAANVNKLWLDNTVIKGVRTALHEKNKLRIVFDLSSSVRSNSFMIAPTGKQQYRMVLDLTPEKQINAQGQPVNDIKPVLVVPKRSSDRDLVVIVDAGHGGKDPGAIGAHGVKEKNVVLAIAKQLQQKLNEQPGIKAYLTRDGDYYIGLRQRLSLARSKRADLFISIHADAFLSSASHGASVFALSQGGASSEAARWLAENENHSELGNASLHDKGYMLRSVLIDLSQTATITASLKLGDNVLKNLTEVAELHNSKVEQAGFVVLKSPDIPSILIETGFISNKREEQLLTSDNYRNALANAIVAGVQNFAKTRVL